MNGQAQSFTTWRERDVVGAGPREPIPSAAHDDGADGAPPGPKGAADAAPATLRDAAWALINV